MAQRMTTRMAIGMAFAMYRDMAHSTPLQTTTSHLSLVVESGSDQIQSDRHLGRERIGFGDLR